MTRDMWEGAILGAVLGSLVIPGVMKLLNLLATVWSDSRPAKMLFQGIACKNEKCKIFVRDFFIQQNTQLYSVEPRLGVGIVPNVYELWPDVEARAVGNLLSALGQIGKIENIEIVRMSQDRGEWDDHVIVLGAQAQKSYDFFRSMKNVAFRMDDKDIFDNVTGKVIEREPNFGYGIILKALNPFKTKGSKGVAILIGGFGVLGTAAASYYFGRNFRMLGKQFKKKTFGIVVRTPISAGEQAVERISALDREFSS